MLWFDVGIKRYTTSWYSDVMAFGCGLMQESKDIQQTQISTASQQGCGLMQESKDIQRRCAAMKLSAGCGLMQESKDIQRSFSSANVLNVVV